MLGLLAVPSASAQETRTLRIALTSDASNVTPFTAGLGGGLNFDLLFLLYDTLFYPTYSTEPDPWLAESFEMSDDFTTWTVQIREGITWHDGEPLTAGDVEFTYNYLQEHEIGLYSHHIYDRPHIETIELIDDQKIEFVCDPACPTFNLSPGGLVPIIPRHIFEGIDDPNTYTVEPTIGSGPYRMVRHEADQLYEFVANEDYFMGAPLIDRLEMSIIPEASAQFLALQSGDVDVVARTVTPEVIPVLEGAGLEVVEVPAYFSVQLNINTQRPPLENPQLRHALNLAVDTATIAETLIGDNGHPGVESFLDLDSPFASEVFEHVYDTAEAQRVLDELDFVDRNNDGVRETPDGSDLDFEILAPAADAREVRAAELVAIQLEEIGVRIRVTPLDPQSLAARRAAADFDPSKPVSAVRLTGDYDMHLTNNYDGHFHFDPDGLIYLFHCPGETGFSAFITGYCNPDFDAAVEAAVTLGIEERVPLLREAQQILYDTAPMISLYFPNDAVAYNPDAFDEWKPVTGHGIIHKVSFLPEREEAAPSQTTEPTATTTSATTAPDSSEDGVPVGLIVGAAVFALAAVAGVGMSRRRKATTSTGPSGPEVD